MNKILLFICLFFFSTIIRGQSKKYWIYFDEKTTGGNARLVSQETTLNRIKLRLPLDQVTDKPISIAHLNMLHLLDIKIKNRSKWLNAVTAYLSDEQLLKVKQLPFVKSLEIVYPNLCYAGVFSKEHDFYPLIQVEAFLLAKQNLNGKDIKIGVIDGGFAEAYEKIALKHVFKNNQLLGVKDFISGKEENFFSKATNEKSTHGADVWQVLSGIDSKADVQYGIAPAANYYLARTDNDSLEYRGEEDNWIAALEWMDSLGVRLINSSLGYSTGHDRSEENYTPADMNGNTTAISKAAQIAVAEKGMVIIVSGGNHGVEKEWEIVSAPADANGVISVGANDKFFMKQPESSIGSVSVPYLKPNISCYSDYGTSFAAPIITGLVACIMQKDRSLKVEDIIRIIEKSGHLYPYGNNYLGYGVPHAGRILKLIENRNYNFNRSREIRQKGNSITFKGKYLYEDFAAVFHKKDLYNVIKQEFLIVNENTLVIQKPDNAIRSTIGLKDRVIEIVWE
jgi:hypothetical protein